MTPAGELLAAEIARDGPISVPPLHGSGALSSRARLLPPRARSVRQGGRLLHGRADPAGLRNPDGRAHPPALPRDGRAARTSRWWNWARAAREMAEAFSRMALRSGRDRMPASCRRGSAAWSSPTSSSTPCRWRWPSIADGAFREQLVGLDGDRFVWQTAATVPPDSGRLPAALLSAARGRPLVRSEPRRRSRWMERSRRAA